MAADLRFDEVLMTMAGQAGSLDVLLRIFFSFLHRNTDFYVTFDPATVKSANMGFPAGHAEKLLLRAFRTFPFKPYTGTGTSNSAASRRSEEVVARDAKRDQESRGRHDSTEPTSTPPTQKSSSTSVSKRSSAKSIATPASTGPARASTSSSEVLDASGASPPCANSAESKMIPPAPPSEPGQSVGGIRVRYTDDGKQIPIGNGGVTPRYYWTQTVTEATVYVDVPEGTSSKDISCEIGPRRLRLVVRGAGTSAGLTDDGDVIIDGRMPSAVSREDSMWSLSDGKNIVISLEKAKRNWWQSVIEGDPEIDTSQVDSTCKVSEFDEETQGSIRKIMFDQRQKSLGLPTSDEMAADNLLEKAKTLPGSPFLPGGALYDGKLGDHTSVAPDGGQAWVGRNGEHVEVWHPGWTHEEIRRCGLGRWNGLNEPSYPTPGWIMPRGCL